VRSVNVVLPFRRKCNVDGGLNILQTLTWRLPTHSRRARLAGIAPLRGTRLVRTGDECSHCVFRWSRDPEENLERASHRKLQQIDGGKAAPIAFLMSDVR
jgi:hypothetical protein